MFVQQMQQYIYLDGASFSVYLSNANVNAGVEVYFNV